MLIQNAGNTMQPFQVGRISSEKIATNNSSPTNSVIEQHLSNRQLKNTVDSFNQVMGQANQNLEFSIDSTTKKPVVKLVDAATKEIIRQIPSEEMLAIARSIDQFQQGTGMQQKI